LRVPVVVVVRGEGCVDAGGGGVRKAVVHVTHPCVSVSDKAVVVDEAAAAATPVAPDTA
jgi:hypothetical protein